jgi:ABC-type multidrug transport system fused ATPase/permease subunit
MFAISGENLTKRLRTKAFKSMLSQDVAWFDSKENNVGVLTTKLAVEASAVQGATGVRLGFILQVLANLGVGIVIAFIYSWSVTLVLCAFVPLMIVSGVFQSKVIGGFTNKDKTVMEKAGKVSFRLNCSVADRGVEVSTKKEKVSRNEMFIFLFLKKE